MKQVSICKNCKNVLILIEKANQRAVLATELPFKCTNDKCKSHHDKGFFTFTKSRGVYGNRKNVLEQVEVLEKDAVAEEDFVASFLSNISKYIH